MSDPSTLEEIMDAHFPLGFVARGRNQSVKFEDLVTETGPLAQEHVELAQEHMERGEPLGITGGVESIEDMRHRHHRIAQMTAAGFTPTQISEVCGITAQYASQLRQSPAFANLVDFYHSQYTDEFGDFVSLAAQVGAEALKELRMRLAEDPKAFTVAGLTEVFKHAADRGGYAPVSKSLNVNMSGDLGSKLAAARQRAALAIKQAGGG